MGDYSKLAKYYDFLVGDSNEVAVKIIKDAISKYRPYAKTILDLACGTGTILKYLAGIYECSGIDISEEMLKIAKNKVKSVTFHKLNMIDFNLNKKFDVVLCIFDSINHLLKFSDWKRLFFNASENLLKGGLFIFDMNTIQKLNRLSSITPLIKDVGEYELTDTVSRLDNRTISFDTVILNKKNGRIERVSIKEASFELEKVKKVLNTYFHILKIERIRNNLSSKELERVFFICKKKDRVKSTRMG